jgi:hypothetical protein
LPGAPAGPPVPTGAPALIQARAAALAGRPELGGPATLPDPAAVLAFRSASPRTASAGGRLNQVADRDSILARLVVPSSAEGQATGAAAGLPGAEPRGRLALSFETAATAGSPADPLPEGALALPERAGASAEAAASFTALAHGHEHAALAPFTEMPVPLGTGVPTAERQQAPDEGPHFRIRGGVEPDAPVVTPGVILPLITTWLDRRDDAYLAERDRRQRRREEENEEDADEAPVEGALHELACAFASVLRGPAKLVRTVFGATAWFVVGAFRLAGRAAAALFRRRPRPQPSA